MFASPNLLFFIIGLLGAAPEVVLTESASFIGVNRRTAPVSSLSLPQMSQVAINAPALAIPSLQRSYNPKLGGCWDLYAMCADEWLPRTSPSAGAGTGNVPAASPAANSVPVIVVANQQQQDNAAGAPFVVGGTNSTMKRRTRSHPIYNAGSSYGSIKRATNKRNVVKHSSSQFPSRSAYYKQKLIMLSLNYMGSWQPHISPIVSSRSTCKVNSKSMLGVVGRFCDEIDSLAQCIDESSKSGMCREWFVSQPEVFRSMSTCLTACRHGCIDRCPDSLQKLVTLG